KRKERRKTGETRTAEVENEAEKQRAEGKDNTSTDCGLTSWAAIGGTRRVNHGHEADEAEVLRGEVHLISVESKALWELVIRQVEMAETCRKKCLSEPILSTI
uniref:Uncharacterized protein n=1 Tax=Labrus bergylta TaxID=56723 RepID=A0A3Q3FI39_9LABR